MLTHRRITSQKIANLAYPVSLKLYIASIIMWPPEGVAVYGLTSVGPQLNQCVSGAPEPVLSFPLEPRSKPVLLRLTPHTQHQGHSADI